jgi:hypothetical protein
LEVKRTSKGGRKPPRKSGEVAGKQGQRLKTGAAVQIFTIEVWNFNPNANVIV